MREAKSPLTSKLVLGMGIGAALMYVFDPQQGRQRRRIAAGEVQRRIAPAAAAVGHWPSMNRDEWIHRAQEHRGSLLGLLVAGAAAALAMRWAMRRAGWRGPAQEAARGGPIDVEKSIQIAAPPEQVFKAWSNYDNFPHFMSMVEEVRPLGGDRSHWVVKGPAGARIEWDAVVTERMPGRLLAWRSEPGGAVDHAGRVQFAPSGSGTRVTVRMSYRPPGGRLGHAVASLLGRSPGQEMDTDLQRMKAFIESRQPGLDESLSTTADSGQGGYRSNVGSLP
jgi:uncharacterized membrane protein